MRPAFEGRWKKYPKESYADLSTAATDIESLHYHPVLCGYQQKTGYGESRVM
jgi:hypothetical protein